MDNPMGPRIHGGVESTQNAQEQALEESPGKNGTTREGKWNRNSEKIHPSSIHPRSILDPPSIHTSSLGPKHNQS